MIRKNFSRSASVHPEIDDRLGDRLADHLKWCRRNRPNARKNPVRSNLISTYITRLEELVAVPRDLRFAAEGLHDLHELRSWAFRPRPKSSSANNAELRKELSLELSKLDIFTEQGAKAWSSGILSHTGGRPVSRRHNVVAALELRRSNPTRTWRQIATEVCDCGKREHNESCLETLKRGLKEFAKLRRKFSLD